MPCRAVRRRASSSAAWRASAHFPATARAPICVSSFSAVRASSLRSSRCHGGLLSAGCGGAAASKASGEMLGIQAHLAHGLPVIRVRAFNHVGPGQAPSFVVSSLARNVAEAERKGTGSVRVGKHIAATAGYKRLVLELGGNDPLIVMEDADLDRAADLAVAGATKNSGQRCTAVKRILVVESVADAFVERVLPRAKALKAGDPMEKNAAKHAAPRFWPGGGMRF